MRTAILSLLALAALAQEPPTVRPWKRSGTTISPRRAGDSVTIGTRSPSGTGTVISPTTGISALGTAQPMPFRPLEINPVLASSSYSFKDPVAYVGASAIYFYYTYGSDPTYLDGGVGYATTSAATTLDPTHQGVVLQPGANGSYDECGAFSPSAPVLVGATYYMWYTAVTDRAGDNCASPMGDDSPWSVAVATAAGLAGPWAKAADLVIDGAGADGHTLDPFVMAASESPDGKYRMYVAQTDAGLGYRVVALYRADLPTGPWTRFGTSFSPAAGRADGSWSGDVENPAVFHSGDRWYLTVDDALLHASHLAESVDGGLTFVEVDAGTIAGPSNRVGSYDRGGADALGTFSVAGQQFAVYQMEGVAGVNAWVLGIGQFGRRQQYDTWQGVNPFRRLTNTDAGGLSTFYLSGLETSTTRRGFQFAYFDNPGNYHNFFGRGLHFVAGVDAPGFYFGQGTGKEGAVNGYFTHWLDLGPNVHKSLNPLRVLGSLSIENGTEPTCMAATDLVVDGTLNTKVTSASHNFVAADVGRRIQITGGAGWTAGEYTVVSTASNAATLNASPAPVTTAAGEWNLNRGLIVAVEGAPGAADTVRRCSKAADNSYSWTAIQ